MRDGLVRCEFKLEEYAELLRGFGLDPDPELIVSTLITDSSVEESVRKLMTLPRPPTADTLLFRLLGAAGLPGVEEAAFENP